MVTFINTVVNNNIFVKDHEHFMIISVTILYFFSFTLQKDKRYLILECVPEERIRLLNNYIEELFRAGPPPPPTASAPSNRSKIHS